VLQASSKLILIAEDIPEAAVLMSRVATAAFPDGEIKQVGDVTTALQTISFFRPSVALIDLSLPDGNGVQIIEALYQRNPKCMIVVATIFDDDAHLFPALQAGAQGYLLKSEPEDLLITKLQGMAAGQPPLSAAIARRLLGFFQNHPSSGEEQLTPREQEVLALLARGMRINALADQLHISRHTAGDHVKNIYRKLNISSRAEAAVKAARLGMLG
jgi:DNA-binding NarL/FixJ family response regulator